MAGPRTCRSPRHNLFPGGVDELVRGPPGASTKGSNIPTPSPPIPWAQTPADTLTPILASLKGTYTNVDLQTATKLALKLFVQDQGYAQRFKP